MSQGKYKFDFKQIDEHPRKTRKDAIDMTGQVFGLLTVISKGRKMRWLCRCECGKTKEISGAAMRAGLKTSCGHDAIRKARKRQDVSWMACKAPGCDKPVKYGRAGHCGPHYWRMLRHGSYDLKRIVRADAAQARERARDKARDAPSKQYHPRGDTLGPVCAHMLSLPMGRVR